MTNDLQSPPSLSSSPSSDSFGVDPHIIRYGSIFLLIVGTFGNILSFIIFSHGALRKSSTFRYLALLSLMDLVVLYSGLLDLFLAIEYGPAYSLRNLNPVTCRLHTFVTYWSQHSSSWILSFISVDRAVATNFIQYARKFCTPRSAEYIVGMIVIFVTLLNCHELIYLRLQDADQPISISSQTSDYHQFTTLSPYRAGKSLSTQMSILTNGFEIANKQKRTIHDETSFFLLSLCDNPQWNFLCSRNKRDVSPLPPSSSSTRDLTNRLFYSPLSTSTSSNATTNMFLFGSTSTISSGRKCAALKDSGYEFFWDNVWEWIDVCLYAFIPFTVMSIGTFAIVYRVYYQQRRVFRSRRSGKANQMGATPNKAKSLFYLLFTLNLLYFILVSPVVLVTTLLFRNPGEEIAYPRFKAIIYLMQYSNHSLNFIFYGITSPPYRKTLCEWFTLLIPHLPACCQRVIRRHSKSNQTTAITRPSTAAQYRISIQPPERRKTNADETIISPNSRVPLDGTAASHGPNESILLLPK